MHSPIPSRRDVLRSAGAGFGMIALTALLAEQGLLAAESTPHHPEEDPLAPRNPQHPPRARRVIFLFMSGGPSHLETFDPKPTAPEGMRSIFGTIPTSLPGVAFGAHFPRLAKLANKLAVVRSFVPGDSNHDAKPIVHRETLARPVGRRTETAQLLHDGAAVLTGFKSRSGRGPRTASRPNRHADIVWPRSAKKTV